MATWLAWNLQQYSSSECCYHRHVPLSLASECLWYCEGRRGRACLFHCLDGLSISPVPLMLQDLGDSSLLSDFLSLNCVSSLAVLWSRGFTYYLLYCLFTCLTCLLGSHVILSWHCHCLSQSFAHHRDAMIGVFIASNKSQLWSA